MLNFQSFYLRLVLISFIFKSVTSDDECNQISVEGGDAVTQKLFNDLNLINTTIQKLKAQIAYNQEPCHCYSDGANMDLGMFDMRIDNLPKKCQRNSLPSDCTAATKCTHRSGIYKIQVPQYTGPPFYVECDAKTDGGGWIVIQRRQDGSIDFYRDWHAYEKGFGNIDGELFIGLEKLYALTNNNGPQELMVVMEHENGTKAYAKYDGFAIGDDSLKYKLKKVGKYSGTAGDSLRQVGYKFTTKDRDNDINVNGNCAQLYKGAWWYFYCHFSNLNGEYGNKNYGQGINWFTFTDYYSSLKYVKMMIRRRRL